MSKFDRGDWVNLYNGFELDEFRECAAGIMKEAREMAAQAETKTLLDHLVI